jgi:hypothetical protein
MYVMKLYQLHILNTLASWCFHRMQLIYLMSYKIVVEFSTLKVLTHKYQEESAQTGGLHQL